MINSNLSRIMGIDYGDTRIGIALTDLMRIIASGYKTILNNEKTFNEILNICKEKNVSEIVFGIPYNSEEKIGFAAEKVINFINNLKNFFKENNYIVKYYIQDEMYTTKEAILTMRELKIKSKKNKKIIDQIAAAKILQSFLENKNKKEFI